MRERERESEREREIERERGREKSQLSGKRAGGMYVLPQKRLFGVQSGTLGLKSGTHVQFLAGGERN